MTMRIALLVTLLTGCADPPPPKPDPAITARLSGHAPPPAQLGKREIVAGMSRVKGEVAGCYDRFKQQGVGMVQLTIDPSGVPTSVTMAAGSSFADAPTGACIIAAVQTARFPAFTGPPMTLTYPFMLR